MTVTNKWPKAAQEARMALYDTSPMTSEQKAERSRLIAREYARREARNNPTPQADLLDSAA